MDAMVVAANLQDVFDGGRIMIKLMRQPHLRPRLQTIFTDGGFCGDWPDVVKKMLHIDLEIVVKKEGQQGFQVVPKLWVVERTYAWISRQRRLVRDYERLTPSSESFIYIAMILLGLRRLSCFSN
jgi:transposase